MDPIFVIKKRIIQGTTPRLTFQILDDNTPAAGFQPDTLVMSVYDVTQSTATPITIPATVASSIVNSQDEVDVIAECDATGYVDIRLVTADTELTAAQVAKCTSKGIRRIVLFEWTWDTGGAGHGAGIFDLTIFPTYKP